MAVTFLVVISYCLHVLNLLSHNISVPFSFLFLLNQFPVSYLYIIKLVLVSSGLKRKLQLKKKIMNQQISIC